MGDLSSPPCQLKTEIFLKRTSTISEQKKIDQALSEKFKGLTAGGTKAEERLGITKMHPSFYRQIRVDVPSIAKTLGGINLDALELPFKESWSESVERELIIRFGWAVSGLTFRDMSEDVLNRWQLSQTLRRKVDVPLELERQEQSRKQTSVAVAASIDVSQKLVAVMGIRNKLKGSSTPNRTTQIMLRISAPADCMPLVAGEFGGQISAPAGPGAPAPPEVTIIDGRALGSFSYIGNVSLKASERKALTANISMPPGVQGTPGSLVSLRAEYWHDGLLAAYGPPATIYLAHPLPSIEDPGPKDIVSYLLSLLLFLLPFLHVQCAYHLIYTQ